MAARALVGTSRSAYARPMFEHRFIEHHGARILRLEFSHLSSHEMVAAADQIRRVISAEPPHSLRTLTILSSKLTAEGADVLKRGALENGPHVLAGAIVATSFWKVIAIDVQAHSREDLRLFDDESSALDWLASV